MSLISYVSAYIKVTCTYIKDGVCKGVLSHLTGYDDVTADMMHASFHAFTCPCVNATRTHAHRILLHVWDVQHGSITSCGLC